MRPISISKLATSALATLAAVVFSSIAQAAPPQRIRAIADEVRAEIPGSTPGRLRASADLGAAPLDHKLTSMTVRFNMTAAQQAALDQLLLDQQNPASSRFHQWLTPEQYAAQFGLNSADLAAVSGWLQGKGFTITGTARSGTFISFQGTVDQAQRAFGTSLHQVSYLGEDHIANVTNPTLPSAIAGVVSGITGLNDFKLRARAKARTVTPEYTPTFTSSLSGNHYIAPGDFYTIYDVSPLLSSSINGTGVTIAVMGQTDISLADVAAFRTASGLTANVPTVKVYGTDPGTSSNDITEAQLDVEWSGAVAPSASILYVNSTDVIGISLTQAIDNNLAPIMSVSYGDCEAGFSPSDLNLFNGLFKQANAQGITVVGPAGDSGATDCDYQANVAVQGLAVDFPASSPYVTGAGGTMFNEGTGTYFNAGNNSNAGSAISYIPEAVWNESSTSNGLASGGGGASTFFTKPPFQVGSGVPVDFSRDVPDISLNAAAGHDGYLFCVSGSCVNGYRNLNGNLAVVGGTSVSTPGFAGILALVEQKIASRIGNANPTIYGLANSTYYNNVFHDTTTGNNASPCTAGTPNCANGGAIGYNAGPGYDLATGWGSVDAFNMANDWKLVTPTGVGSLIGSAISTTTVTASAASVPVGTPVTLTVKVAAGSGTTVPTGTAQVLVDNVPIGTALTIVNGTATYALSSSGLSSGSHTLSAAYSGDATFAGSKGSFLLDIISVSTPDFSLTPSTAAVTVASGQTANGVVFTVTPANGFTGNVTFSASTNSSNLAVTPSFTINPVVITSGSGTTTLSLLASVSAGQYLPVGTAANRPPGKLPWYAAGSGVTLACLLMFVAPRRRRLGVLLAMAACATVGLAGCSTAGSVLSTTTVIKAIPGTYNITVTAIATTASGTLSHNSTVTLTVQ